MFRKKKEYQYLLDNLEQLEDIRNRLTRIEDILVKVLFENDEDVNRREEKKAEIIRQIQSQTQGTK